MRHNESQKCSLEWQMKFQMLPTIAACGSPTETYVRMNAGIQYSSLVLNCEDTMTYGPFNTVEVPRNHRLMNGDKQFNMYSQ